MNIKYPINYSGYIPVLRAVLLLLKSRTISFNHLGPYLFFVMQADFDLRHNHYGAITRDDRQLAKVSGVASTTIYRHRKELIKAGVLIEKKGVTYITNFKLFELGWVKKNLKLNGSYLEELFVTPQENIAEDENEIANLKTEHD